MQFCGMVVAKFSRALTPSWHKSAQTHAFPQHNLQQLSVSSHHSHLLFDTILHWHFGKHSMPHHAYVHSRVSFFAGPPKPQPTPSNTHAQQQRQHQQVTQSQQLALFRQQLWQGPAAAAATAAAAAAAAAEHQGLHVSRWLAAASAYVPVPMDSHLLPNSDTGALDASQRQRQRQQQQQLMPAAGTNPARSGELPYSWFSAYPHLVHLRVVGCGASGVLQGGRIAGAKRLASLVLSHNKLQGTLPDSIVGLQVGWCDC
jgi:hypothetical protein